MDMYKDKVILLFIKDFNGIMEFRIDTVGYYINRDMGILFDLK